MPKKCIYFDEFKQYRGLQNRETKTEMTPSPLRCRGQVLLKATINKSLLKPRVWWKSIQHRDPTPPPRLPETQTHMFKTITSQDQPVHSGRTRGRRLCCEGGLHMRSGLKPTSCTSASLKSVQGLSLHLFTS